jgi:hypothetical protein
MKTKEYNIGDIIKTVDGIGYNGDSLSYRDGWIAEIIDVLYENGKVLYKLKSGVSYMLDSDDIEKRLFTVIQKLKKYGKILKFVGFSGYLVHKDGEVEKIKIIDYDYSEEKYIIKSKSFEGTPFEYMQLFINELDAYKVGHNILLKKHLILKGLL